MASIYSIYTDVVMEKYVVLENTWDVLSPSAVLNQSTESTDGDGCI